MEKNMEFTAVCEEYSFEGDGTVHQQGMVFFVPGLIKGEKALLSVTSVKKTYGYARIVEIIEPSVHRVKENCSAYRLCGGCQLLHMDIEEQHRFKEEKVKECFARNAKMDVNPLPILFSAVTEGYRNKVQVPVQVIDHKVQMGFYQNHSNTIVETDNCLVQSELSNSIVHNMRQWLQELGCGSAFRHVLIKHAQNSNQLMIVMIVREYPFRNADRLKEKILAAYPDIQSLSAVINRRSDNVILDGQDVLIAGTPYIQEQLLDCTFEISARSFFQINASATALLYQTVLDYAKDETPQVLIDLYCGTGTIGILAAKQSKKVYGIEIVPDAVKDARRNAEINHIENAEFFTADASKGAQRILASHIHAGTVVVDPPRKGCSKDTLDAILKISPNKLIYVSCNPATLARDCAYMNENGYSIQTIQPVDMFPGTVHVETVVLMSRVKD